MSKGIPSPKLEGFFSESPKPERRRSHYQCLRCGYAWIGRKPRPPVKCARCGSVLWCRPRVRKGDFRRCGLHNKLKWTALKLKPIPVGLLDNSP